MKKKFLALSLAILIGSSQILTASAAREDEINQSKQQAQSELDATYAKIENMEAQQQALLSEIDEKEQELVQIMAAIDLLNNDIANKEVEIEKTKEDLAEAEAERDKQYEAMKTRIQYLYENGGSDAWAQMLLEDGDLSNFLSKAENTQQLYQYDKESRENFINIVNQTQELENQLETEKGDLEGMKQESETQKQQLEDLLAQKKAESSDYDTQIANAQSMAAEYTEMIQEYNAELQRIEEERQAEEARKKAEAEAAQKRAQEEARSQSEAQQEEEESSSSNSTAAGSSNTSRDEGYTNTNTNTNTDTDTSSSDTSDDEDDSYYEEEEQEEESTGSSSQGSATGSAIVNYALQFVGNPYVWGGTSLTNGADCSGFVQQVYAHFGYSLPRTSSEQRSVGRAVSYSEAQPGDIICYSGHVAIYMGNGQIVHASNSAPYPQGGIKVSPNAAYQTILSVRRVVG